MWRDTSHFEIHLPITVSLIVVSARETPACLHRSCIFVALFSSVTIKSWNIQSKQMTKLIVILPVTEHMQKLKRWINPMVDCFGFFLTTEGRVQYLFHKSIYYMSSEVCKCTGKGLENTYYVNSGVRERIKIRAQNSSHFFSRTYSFIYYICN